MGELPSMWRVELLHPLVAHFPIALLIAGTVVRLAGDGVRPEGSWGFLLPAGRLALAAGAATAWLAVYTGDLANIEVARSLCDPTVKKAHEQLAFAVAVTFTATVALDLAGARLTLRPAPRTMLRVLVAVALVAGAGLIGYTGHLGSRLVYQQAAGVHRPTAACTEFE